MNTTTAGSGSEGVERIAIERDRQRFAEGYSSEHDDRHSDGQIANAAACYAMTPRAREQRFAHLLWPWGREWWKPAKTTQQRIRDLEKAGALIAAEIDRLLRAAN